MRTFIAIPIPVDTVKLISQLSFFLKNDFPWLRWVHTDNYHITLQFLGEINQQHLKLLDKLLQQIDVIDTFTLKVEKFGAFPSLKNTRVFWLGFSYPRALADLYHALEAPIGKAGIKLDNKGAFKPHLTLARTKKDYSLNENIIDASKLPNLSIPAFSVDRFYLYKSELTPKGPIYTVLNKYLLK